MRKIKQKIMTALIVCSILTTQVINTGQTSVEPHKKEKEGMSPEWEAYIGGIVGTFVFCLISFAFEELAARRQYHRQRMFL